MSIIFREGDIGGEDVNRVAITTLEPRRVATAIRIIAGSLKLIIWNVDANGKITKGDEASAIGNITDIGIATLTPGRMVTASRTGNKMKLIVWDFNNLLTPSITQKDFASIGPVLSAAGVSLTHAIASLTNSRVITVSNAGTGKLKIMVWDILANGDLMQRGSASAGTIKSVAIAPLTPKRVVTAARGNNDSLNLIVWDVSADGIPTKISEASAGPSPIKEVAIARLNNVGVVTAVRSNNDHLKVAHWKLNTSAQIQPQAEASAGAVKAVAITSDPTISSGVDFITAARNGAGNLELKGWDIIANGIAPAGDAAAGAIANLAAAGWVDGSVGAVVTAVRAGNGKLKLIVWHIQKEPA